MNERRDENWLDEQLRRAIRTPDLKFDADAWKRDHAEAHEALVARGQTVSGSDHGTGRTMRSIARRLAVAAVILIGLALLLTRPAEQAKAPERHGQGMAKTARAVAPAPVRMLSMMSLRSAYQQGGQEALNQTLDAAMKQLGPRPGKLSAKDVLDDLEG